MAKTILASAPANSKKDIRAKLTAHEVELLAELIALYGWRVAAARFARRR